MILLLDTSVVIDWGDPAVVAALPDESVISAITLGELATGPHLTADTLEAARRQSRLQEVEANFEVLPYDASAARSYGMLVAATMRTGRSHRGRVADLMIAATAHANRIGVLTRNPDDFRGLDDLVEIVAV